VTSMKKAKQIYYAKMQEYQKALKAEGEQQVGQGLQAPKMNSTSSSSALGQFYSSSSGGKVDKKKKQEEDSSVKVKCDFSCCDINSLFTVDSVMFG